MTENELAYLAGIIDGEGCISIYRVTIKRDHPSYKTMRSPNHAYVYKTKLVITNTDQHLIDWLQTTVTIRTIGIRDTKDPKHKLAYKWEVYGTQMKEILSAVMPYLILKKQQAALAIEMVDSTTHGYGNGHPVPASVWQRRAEIFEENTILNRRGRVA